MHTQLFQRQIRGISVREMACNTTSKHGFIVNGQAYSMNIDTIQPPLLIAEILCV